MSTVNTAIKQFEFQFQATIVRAVSDEEGNPWFCAKDVCEILGYRNHNETIKYHCRQDGVANCYPLETSGGLQYPIFISEGNLYRLIIKSNKPEAEPFERWVCDEVLPSIRKYGYYLKPEKTEASFGDLFPGGHPGNLPPFQRINAAFYTSLRKHHPDLANAYLAESGVTPEYVAEQLAKLQGYTGLLAQTGGAQTPTDLHKLIPSFVEDWQSGNLIVQYGPIHVHQAERLFSHWCIEHGYTQAWSRFGVGTVIARTAGLRKARGRYRWGKKLTQGWLVMPQYDRPPVGVTLEDYLTECVHKAEDALRSAGA